jgi:hypothetical protein
VHHNRSRLGQKPRPDCQTFTPFLTPEQTLVTTTYKRLIAALAFVLPAAALVATPVMAASQTKAKTHHSSVHKASHHKKAASTTAPTS